MLDNLDIQHLKRIEELYDILLRMIAYGTLW